MVESTRNWLFPTLPCRFVYPGKSYLRGGFYDKILLRAISFYPISLFLYFNHELCEIYLVEINNR